MSEEPTARPALEGLRVLVTRAKGQASELAERLRALGATAVLIPTIEIGPPASYAGLDSALAALSDFDLVVFSSANAVEAFDQRARVCGVTPKPSRVAVVGPGTARALESIGLHANVVSPVFTAEGLAVALRPEASGRRILLVLAEQASTTLQELLATAGARITVATAYGNRIPDGAIAAIATLFEESGRVPDAVTFTSASTARNLRSLLDAAGLVLPESVVRASIGPITSRALIELALPPHVEAKEPTIAALTDALAAYFPQKENF